MKKAMGVCKIPECYNDIQCPTMGICKACYSSMLSARNKPKHLREARLRNLAKYTIRTQLIHNEGVIRSEKSQPVTLSLLPGYNSKRFKLKKKNGR